VNVILLGPQGSGKGTQAAELETRLGLRHIASGDLLREARELDTPLGRLVKKYYDAGELVPDDVVIELIVQEINKHLNGQGVVLDGFPRNVTQAQALDKALASNGRQIDKVVELVAPLEVVKKRLTGRLICRTCGAVYNLETKPPKVPGKCDLDGGELYQRPDDTPEAIEKRLQVWAKENEGLVNYYQSQGILYKVDANKPVEQVTQDIMTILKRDL